VASLERLLDAITNSEYDELKKNSLIYWLLKWHHDGRDTTFQLEKCIPPHFVTLADAYWSVDTGRDLAVSSATSRFLYPSPLNCVVAESGGNAIRFTPQARVSL
jgi:hypothetical protein